MQCIDYGPDNCQTTDIVDLEHFLKLPRPDWAKVRWLNIDGLHPFVVHRVMKSYKLHTLAAEDVLHVPQRPKLEPFDTELFIVMRMLTIEKSGLMAEQISLFYRPDLLITFQELPGDAWQSVRGRIKDPASRLRAEDASLLLHRLLDVAIDQCFPILEKYGDMLEDLEEAVAQNPKPDLLHQLYSIKRQLVHIRRVMWPMREMFRELLSEDHETISKTARTYLRDVYDHAVQLIDIIETYREMAAGLTELYMSSVSNRMNEVMKVLTIMASLFIPITFIAGVYGMNFEYLPELHFQWAYPLFWIICITITSSLLIFFKRKGWLG